MPDSGSVLLGRLLPYLAAIAVLFLCPAPARAQSYTFSHLAGSDGGAESIDGTGSAARFNTPGGVAVDSSGKVYVAETHNHTIRQITPARVVATPARLAGSL